MPKYPHIELLTQLVRDSVYTIDETAVAEAIVARSVARSVLPDTRFRNDLRRSDERDAEVRSFRPSRRVRSFHLERRPSTTVHH